MPTDARKDVAERTEFNRRTRRMAEDLYNLFTDMYDNFDTTANQIIAAATDQIRAELSAHERKVQELVSAAKEQVCSTCPESCCGRLRAALKELGEEPGALGKGKDASA